MKRVLRMTGALLLAGGSVLVPTAAQATPPAPELPDGYVMYTVACSHPQSQYSIYEIDPVTGQAELVGTPNPQSYTHNAFNCAAQGTYNPVTHEHIFVGFGDHTDWSVLADLGTGESTVLQHLPNNRCGLAVDNSGTYFQPGTDTELEIVDPHTAVTTPLPSSDIVGSNCALAVNPVDDELISFEVEWPAGNWYVQHLNKVDGSTTRGVQLNFADRGGQPCFSPSALAIDSNGIAWVKDDCYGNIQSGIVAIDLATGYVWPMATGAFDAQRALFPTAQEIADGENGEGYFYQMGIWIAPDPNVVTPNDPSAEPSEEREATLAATGVDAGGLARAAAIAIAGALLVCALRGRARVG